MARKAQKKLPKLEYGEGTMFYSKTGKIIYKKIIQLPDGDTFRKTIHGATVMECIKRMEREENKLVKQCKYRKARQTLNEEMLYWLTEVKKNTLKRQSYQRLESIIRNHVINSPIGHRRISMITSSDIQTMLNSFNNGKYTYSTIKKIYDCLNEFYRYISIRDQIYNPMIAVACVDRKNVIKEQKKPEFLNNEDIQKFKDEAIKKWKSSGRPRYRYGQVLVANLYMGLRIGELLALKWKDVSFSDNVLAVNKTLVQEYNPDYDDQNPEKMKKKNIKKVRYVVQESTKTGKNRKVPINKTAMKHLTAYYEQSEYTEPDDFVITTRNRKSTSPKNIQYELKAIINKADVSVQSSNTHIMRHTCASLLYNNGIELHTIAKILGNSEEVLRKTYVHFEEDNLISAMEAIEDIE